jgi:thiol:disulfide interchange protein
MTFRSVAFFSLLAGFSLTTHAQSGAGSSPAIVPFDPSRDAAKDVREAVAQAPAAGRRILLDVGGQWCIWCRRMDTLFATNADLRRFREANYLTVKVNYSKENKNEALLSKYPGIVGYPHIFVLEKDGTLLHSQDTGLLEKGREYDPERVMEFLKKWSPPKASRAE